MWTDDNFDIMRGMNVERVDLIYHDPPSTPTANTAPTPSASASSFSSAPPIETPPSSLIPTFSTSTARTRAIYPLAEAVVDASAHPWPCSKAASPSPLCSNAFPRCVCFLRPRPNDRPSCAASNRCG